MRKKCKKKNTNKNYKPLEHSNTLVRKKSARGNYKYSLTHGFIDWKCFNFEEQDNEDTSNSQSVSSSNSESREDLNYTIKLN